MARHVPNVLDPFADPYLSKEERAEYAEGLRALADWVEASDFPLHRAVRVGAALEMHDLWIDDESFIKRVGSAAKLIGGKVRKVADTYAFTLIREFKGGVKFEYRISRNAVCEPVTKTRMVEKDVASDADRERELKDELEKLDRHSTLVSETYTDYVCPPSLLEAEQKHTSEVVVSDDIPF
jgi:hypothetical protein